MVQKSFRFLLLIIILSGCKTDNTIIGKVNNENSVHSIWNYTIGYKTYNENKDELREGKVDPFAWKFFKVKLKGDESFISFFLMSFSKKNLETQHDVPVYLYMDNYLVDIKNKKNETIDVYMTSPIDFKESKKGDNSIEIISKKDVDYYLVYVNEVGSDSLAFSFITNNNVSEVNLSQFKANSQTIDIKDYLNSSSQLALISMYEPFMEGKKYYIYGMGFIRNSFGNVVQFTSQPIEPFLF